MVNVRFRGVELEESAKSEEARRRNPTAEAEEELLDSVGEAYSPHAANIGLSIILIRPFCTTLFKVFFQTFNLSNGSFAENWQRLAGFSIGITR